MCMIDGCDPCEVYRAKICKARKEHKCAECGRTIGNGEEYHYAFMVQEGCGDSFHTCQHCYVAADWLIVNCGGFVHNYVLEEIEAHAREYPYLHDELVALSDGMRAHWKGAAELPKLPSPITVSESAP